MFFECFCLKQQNYGYSRKTYSFAEYLVLEAETGEKFEYHDGFLAAMAGGTLVHAKISVNIGSMLSNALRQKECIAFP
jgi:Uma2 family endonuclease